MTQVKNIVFDIGNVMVRWSPAEIIRLSFGDDADVKALTKSLFHGDIWLDLNRGRFSEKHAQEKYQQQFDFTDYETERLFYYIKVSLVPLFNSQALLMSAKEAGYHVYALTDNVTEIVSYLKAKYDFWQLFDGEIISADHDCLKPQSEIYKLLTSKYDLDPSSCLFLDDVAANVEGAKKEGWQGIQFSSVEQCLNDMHQIGIDLTL